MSVSTLAQKINFDTLDDAVNVLKRIGGAFAPHEQNPPVMSVRLDAGQLFDPSVPTLTEVSPQNTVSITAPVSNPRIDRVVIDETTGAVSVITGMESASPTPPALSSGKIPICQVRLNTGATSIINDDLTDERPSGIGIKAASSGAVTSVDSGTGLTGGPITTTGTLNVDVGTTANKIVQLDGSAKLPAVDGSLLTGINSGKIIQVVSSVSSTTGSTTTTIPWDDTVPTNTEGAEMITAAITPNASTNKIIVLFSAPCANSTNTDASIAIFQDTTCKAAQWITAPEASGLQSQITMSAIWSPSTTTEITVRVRGGLRSAGTFYWNAISSGVHKFGSALNMSLIIMEVEE
jgi:hypothetical protein